MNKNYIKPWIEEVEAYIPGKTIEGCIKLASNENNYGPSPKVLAAINKSRFFIHMYPYKDAQLKDAVGRYCGVSGDNIIFGNGSDELIDIILKTFRGPLLTFKPTFASYRIYASILNEKYFEVNLRRDFSFPLNEFIEQIKKANIIFLCTPNNPTGTKITKKEIKEILDEEKPVVVDEAYFEFCNETAVGLLRDYDNLMILRTFAKAFALAGLRIGYCIANPETIRMLHKVKPPFNVNLIAQEAALAALGDIPYMKSTVKKIVRDKEKLYKKLSEKYKPLKSYTNFIFVDVSPHTAIQFYERLLKKGFITRPFGKIGGFPGEYCRITVGTTKETQKLLSALDEI